MPSDPRVTQALRWVFLVSYTAVHLRMEWGMWAHGGTSMFTKYQAAASAAEEVDAAKRVYWCKALWCWLMVVLQGGFGLRFWPALSISFAAYSAGLVALFDFAPYLGLNVALAVGMLLTQLR